MTHSFNEFKETYTDTMQVTGHDILNLVHASDMMPTLRKTIDRNCPIQSTTTQNGIIKSNLISIFKDVSEKDMKDDSFFKGYAIAETVINQALHFWFMEQYDCKMSDIDIIFNVDADGKPRLEIEIEGHTDGGDGDGDNDTPDAPLPFAPQIQKVKDKLN
tara:strand:- start:151 stop:630 length:480 start_codon:yes stop_codon:yes gene_type:complete